MVPGTREQDASDKKPRRTRDGELEQLSSSQLKPTLLLTTKELGR